MSCKNGKRSKRFMDKLFHNLKGGDIHDHGKIMNLFNLQLRAYNQITGIDCIQILRASQHPNLQLSSLKILFTMNAQQWSIVHFQASCIAVSHEFISFYTSYCHFSYLTVWTSNQCLISSLRPGMQPCTTWCQQRYINSGGKDPMRLIWPEAVPNWYPYQPGRDLSCIALVLFQFYSSCNTKNINSLIPTKTQRLQPNRTLHQIPFCFLSCLSKLSLKIHNPTSCSFSFQ